MKKLTALLLCFCLCFRFAWAEASGSPEAAEEGCIGIISAMENEVKLLLSQARIDRVDTVGGVDFHVGVLCGRNVVIARAGIGKVLSASGTSAMLSRYPISSLIFTGIAGGVGDETHVLDVVIATELVQHDYGAVTGSGFEWNPPEDGGEGHYFCDPALADAAYRAAADVIGEEHVFRGLIATGDQFIASEEYVKLLQERFGAIACEMEGASVAAVCERYGVPCVIIRTMSDKADGQAHESYENMGDLAADRSGTIVIRMLEDMGKSGTEKSEKRIFVAETTDIHGYIMDVSMGSEEKFQYRLARIARLIDEARASGRYDHVLLLDGGDLYQGAPVSLLTGGAVIRAALDAMGYDAVGLGNHEFDWEVTEYAADAEGTLAPYEMGDRFGDPAVPVLAANLYDAAARQRVPFTRDYAVIEKAGLRIAVIGYIPDYRATIRTSSIEPYYIDPDLQKLDALVRQVHENERPDATVIIVHDNPMQVARAMDPGLVQLVCGGHTNDKLAMTAENGIACIQGGYHGQGFASAMLVVESDGTVRVEELQYTDITGEKALLWDTAENARNLDAEILALSHDCWNAVREEMSEVLGYIDTPVVRTEPVGANSAGNWFTSLMLKATRDQESVAAFYNNRGIRASFYIPRGQTERAITVNDIYSFAPFGNALLVYELSGPELAAQLAKGLKNESYGDQMSGLTFTYTATGDDSMDRADREYTILSITLDDGTQVDMNDTQTVYRVCTSNFNATVPGSVFEGKEPIVPEADAPTDNEAFVRVLREEGSANGGHIAVDTAPRGAEVEMDNAAGGK